MEVIQSRPNSEKVFGNSHFFPPFIGWGGNQESKHQQLSTNPGQSVNDSSSCINPFNCRHLID